MLRANSAHKTSVFTPLALVISRAFAARQLRHISACASAGFPGVGAVQSVVDSEQGAAASGSRRRAGGGVLFQLRQKVFGHHHGGAAGVGDGPAPVAVCGFYLH